MDAKRFVDKLIEVLNQENERRDTPESTHLDVAFMLAAVEQHIGEPQYATFLSEIDDDVLMGYESPGDDDYYTIGSVHIPTNTSYAGVYHLTFYRDERMHGYCECDASMVEYNPKYRCCGHGCDWSAPAFSIVKHLHVGGSDWTGDESDYWSYKESVNAHIAKVNTELAKAQREREAQRLRDEIARLQEQLAEVE